MPRPRYLGAGAGPIKSSKDLIQRPARAPAGFLSGVYHGAEDSFGVVLVSGVVVTLLFRGTPISAVVILTGLCDSGAYASSHRLSDHHVFFAGRTFARRYSLQFVIIDRGASSPLFHRRRGPLCPGCCALYAYCRILRTMAHHGADAAGLYLRFVSRIVPFHPESLGCYPFVSFLSTWSRKWPLASCLGQHRPGPRDELWTRRPLLRVEPCCVNRCF